MLLFLATACSVASAPEDLDGLVHWLWDNHGAKDEVDWEQTLANFVIALDPLDELLTGDLSVLSAEQVSGVRDADPSTCRGLVMARRYSCSLSQLEPILYALDQQTLYEGVYTDYSRSYTSDLDDYVGRVSPILTWQVSASAELLGVAYTEQLNGGLHFVDTDAGGPALMAQAWMPGPATFEADGWSWNQDYQIELWLEPTPGTLWHVYGLWRDMDLGGLGMDNDGVANTTLDGMSDWDTQTEALCAEAR
jgi:hypothetical protein